MTDPTRPATTISKELARYDTEMLAEINHLHTSVCYDPECVEGIDVCELARIEADKAANAELRAKVERYESLFVAYVEEPRKRNNACNDIWNEGRAIQARGESK